MNHLSEAALLSCSLCLAAALSVSAQEGFDPMSDATDSFATDSFASDVATTDSGDGEDNGPDISEPGPDMGDFPNSAFTLPQGAVYVEMAPCTLSSAEGSLPATYSWPYLLRYGITDDVEFRFLGNGLTSVSGTQDTTGFSPLMFDLKVHLWDDQREWLIPAASLEVYIQSNWGSSAFVGGTQPSLNMNFDLPLTEATNLEWTFGYAGVQDNVDIVTGESVGVFPNLRVPVVQYVSLNTYEFSFQWAVERQVTERLQLFVHGYYNGAIFLQQGSGSVIGGGFFWTLSQRHMIFASCNAGLDHNVAPVAGQFGFAVAF